MPLRIDDVYLGVAQVASEMIWLVVEMVLSSLERCQFQSLNEGESRS